jgi:hypothetical protein
MTSLGLSKLWRVSARWFCDVGIAIDGVVDGVVDGCCSWLQGANLASSRKLINHLEKMAKLFDENSHEVQQICHVLVLHLMSQVVARAIEILMFVGKG